MKNIKFTISKPVVNNLIKIKLKNFKYESIIDLTYITKSIKFQCLKLSVKVFTSRILYKKLYISTLKTIISYFKILL